jgi:hypothetical protein
MARIQSVSAAESAAGQPAGGAGTSVDALFELGISYSTGREVDFVLAHKYFNLAAMRGNEKAKRYRMEISREMSRQEVAEAQRQAREWMRCH